MFKNFWIALMFGLRPNQQFETEEQAIAALELYKNMLDENKNDQG